MVTTIIRKFTAERLLALATNLQLSDEEADVPLPVGRGSKKKPAINMFDLLNDGSGSDQNEEVLTPDNESEGEPAPAVLQTGAKPKKRNKKKRKHQQQSNGDDVEDDFLFEETSQGTGGQPTSLSSAPPRPVPSKDVLTPEQKNLNSENELKKIFGSRIVTGAQKKKARGRTYVKSTWLISAKDNWSQIKKTGLSMSLDQTKDGCFYFKYEHNKEYRQIQYSFWDAVSSLNPANIVAIVNMFPYHIDSLIQLSDICRMSEDPQMASELIERALYILESAFHPSFNLASGKCRLEYKNQENRALFLAIFKHLVFIGLRGCYRTALEFCKVLYSLDVENDPLAVVLMIDFYALKAQEYAWFIEFFNTFESKKNLSQLPNMAYAIALAHFFNAKNDSRSLVIADDFLQKALLMFPGVLIPLLDKCSIQADSRVTTHEYFSPRTPASLPPSLNNLIQLYVGRSYHIWKDAELLPWLERNANKCLDDITRNPSTTADYEEKRKKRYQGTPRNIYRHILLCDIKDATATLPQELADAAVMSFDPLPPVDSVSSYNRQNRSNNSAANTIEGGIFSTFFRSLMPGYNPQPAPNGQHGFNGQQPAGRAPLAGAEVDDGLGEEGAAANLQRSVGALVTAMRDLLGTIHLPNMGNNDESNDDDDNSDD
uniref:EOG090X0BCY n=1 Tax=Moina brachiata TaxID=675436 RepID=A0A4Y7NIZ3_9CRUS|nr:EOG090X0BCY [Moina brachiata]SVE93198.1 EOG090X0BCY [Moina brachiata]